MAEQALEKVILDLRENGVGRNKEGKDASGRRGRRAACARPVRFLPCASYPTYRPQPPTRGRRRRAEPGRDCRRCSTARCSQPTRPAPSIRWSRPSPPSITGGYRPRPPHRPTRDFTPFYESVPAQVPRLVACATRATHGTDRSDAPGHRATPATTISMRSAVVTYDTAAERKSGNNPFDVVAKALGLGEADRRRAGRRRPVCAPTPKNKDEAL